MGEKQTETDLRAPQLGRARHDRQGRTRRSRAVKVYAATVAEAADEAMATFTHLQGGLKAVIEVLERLEAHGETYDPSS